MKQSELIDTIKEQIKDTKNITELLMVELSANEDDCHIIRSIWMIEKILDNTLENIEKLYAD